MPSIPIVVLVLYYEANEIDAQDEEEKKGKREKL